MYFEEFRLDDTRMLAPVQIEKDEMIDFAKKYDNIPLHTDEAYAKTTRFGGLIASGILSFMAVWAKFRECDFFGEEMVAGRMTKIDWFKPVYAGDVLTGRIRVTGLTERSIHNGVVELTIDVFNQHGDLALRDVTEVVVARRKTWEE